MNSRAGIWFLIMLILLVGVKSFGQSNKPDENGGEAPNSKDKSGVFNVVEQMPEYPGGTSEMMKFLTKNIVYPKKMSERLFGGKVYIKFVVDKTGNITDVEVLKGSGFKDLDEEALRVVKSMPAWTPGKMDGRNVDVYFNLPIVFGLNDPFFVREVKNKDSNYDAAFQYLENKDYDGAKNKFEEALKTGDDSAGCFYNIGVIFFWQKKKNKACVYFKNAANNGHKTAETMLNVVCK